ncbi:endonuclease/exonuclease/phosphatase family protein [Nannocystis sp. RBIL2]|uniref:endonuclease/exonuclease/phosphatase family protein n=1 Tax=Nannocystis sp. RBIL2 TaxID=2996788 RepID=UPI002271B3EE|nr:endonuclease/exonuclease/phosphatase family protein [Nannocystis sp. RBIL2]MCY1067231.1 endonuclease/exonuclease/phosphatase family protein [Nannocystis sp. RBIL2]
MNEGDFDDFVGDEDYVDEDDDYGEEDNADSGMTEDAVSDREEKEEPFVDPFETLSDDDAPWLTPLPQQSVRRFDSGRSMSSFSQFHSPITINRNPLIDLGVVTWNINHMNKTKPKYFSKKYTLARLFTKNPWLDVLVLQEINQVSLQSFPNDILAHGLKLALGPHMVSIGPKGGKGQHEYYPLVYRADRLTFDGCWALHRGRWIACPEGQTIFWTKPQHKKKNKGLRGYASYRPIVVYRMILPGGGFVYIANVHTTPKGSGLSRKHEFDQVKFILQVARARGALGEHWIVVGDYYLDPEASVMDRGHDHGRAGRFEHAVNSCGLDLVIPLSASNQTGLSAVSEHYEIEVEDDGEDEDAEEDGDASKKEKALLFNKLMKAREAGAFTQADPKRAFEHALQSDKRKPKTKGSSDNHLADRVVMFTLGGGNRRIKVVLNKRADFFICTRGLTHRFCGMVSPVSGILHVDPNHNALNWWCTVSDHAPIGAIFCNHDYSAKLAEYRRDFAVTYSDELEDSKMELEKIRARVKFEALQILEGLLNKLYLVPPQAVDHNYWRARRVLVYLSCMLKLVGTDLKVVSRPIPGDAGVEQVFSNEQVYHFVNVEAFARDALRWSPLNDTLVALTYEAARAAYRCMQISGYKVFEFDFVDETDLYDDRDTDENDTRQEWRG